MLAFVRERESEFVELLTKKNERDLNRQFRECSRELEQATQRITKLDGIINGSTRITSMVKSAMSVSPR